MVPVQKRTESGSTVITVAPSAVSGVAEMSTMIEVTRAYAQIANLLQQQSDLHKSAIEKLADRLTTDHDPQIGRVKDMGSAAVGVALVMAGLFWLFAIAERMGAI